MNELLFISSNQNKIREVKEILGPNYKILGLKDLGFYEDIPEPFETILENSQHKATFFYQKTKMPCLAEDSGLEVNTLNGKPSAHSARYAGEPKSDLRNLEKILTELESKKDRSAKFVSIFTYKSDQHFESFYGEMKGQIAHEPKGSNGFGYDPIFISEGEYRTNGELNAEEKNAISHRKKALNLLIDFLTKRTTSFSSLN